MTMEGQPEEHRNERRPDRDILVETNRTLTALKEELLGLGRSGKGRIDKIEDTMAAHALLDDVHFKKIDDQLSRWNGALTLMILLITVFGALIIGHIFFGGR
jgi:hypothetical protein